MAQKKPRFNELLASLMDECATISRKKGEAYREKMFKTAEEVLLEFPEDIHAADQPHSCTKLTNYSKRMIREYLSTGKLSFIENERGNLSIHLFGNIYGVGPEKAKQIANMGITSLDELRLRDDREDILTNTRRQGLRYFDDLEKKIPWDEVALYEQEFRRILDEVVAASATPDVRHELHVVGSFRRRVPTCRDIDVMIVTDNKDIQEGFIKELKKRKIIVHMLTHGTSKGKAFGRLPSLPHSTMRKIDFMFVPYAELPFSMVYFTGSKMFNVVMRSLARHLGYVLNEHGIYHATSKTTLDDADEDAIEEGGKKKRKRRETIDGSRPIEGRFESEADIFKFLNLEYKLPEERIDGRAIVKVMEAV